MRVAFATDIPSPYQVELFDALASAGHVEPLAIYWRSTDTARSWRVPELNHEHLFLGDVTAAQALGELRNRDLVVFSGYRNAAVRRLVRRLHAAGAPWVFWGERPGFVLPAWLGRQYRRMVFPLLRSPNVPIWAIGTWAVAGYEAEFGSGRKVINVPYFSRLARFFDIDRSAATDRPRRILFSGSLVKRKGVDLLLRAFIALAEEFRDVELHLLGDGPLREEMRALAGPAADRVRFLGFRQWEELPAHYAANDILCAPSRHDGWGLVIPEALAAGLLVVSTDRTGAALDLVDERCGWTVPAGTLAPLVEALRAALSTSGAERRSRIAAGRSVAAACDVAAGAGRVRAAAAESIDCFNGCGVDAPSTPRRHHCPVQS